MRRIPERSGQKRRGREAFRERTLDALESRALLADGITASAAVPLYAVAGVPIRNAVFASFTVTDPTASPGTQWRALINFGDGQSDGPVIPVEKGEEFEFVDTHTYKTPGNYTVTIMIALPGSMKPNDNTVTTKVTVSPSTGTPSPQPKPTSTPTPTSPPPPPLRATGLKLKVRDGVAFRANLANLREAHAAARAFAATVAWGDQSVPTAATIRRRGPGRFTVIGTHRYHAPGIYQVNIAIRDASGQQVVTQSTVRVIKR
jgi:hypothetical protein